MEPAETTAEVHLELPEVAITHLKDGSRQSLGFGLARIASTQTAEPITFFNLDSFYTPLRKEATPCFRIEYRHSVSFVLHHAEGGLVSLSIFKNNLMGSFFEETIRKFTNLVTYQEALAHEAFKRALHDHAPHLHLTPIISNDKILGGIDTVGLFIGSGLRGTGKFISRGVNAIGEWTSSKITEPKPWVLSDKARERWTDFRDGGKKIVKVTAEVFSAISDPVAVKVKAAGNQISTKVQESSNQKLKYSADVCSSCCGSVGQVTYGCLGGAAILLSSIGTQIVNVWTKKYGPDVPQTVFGVQMESASAIISESPQTVQPSILKDEGSPTMKYPLLDARSPYIPEDSRTQP